MRPSVRAGIGSIEHHARDACSTSYSELQCGHQCMRERWQRALGLLSIMPETGNNDAEKPRALLKHRNALAQSLCPASSPERAYVHLDPCSGALDPWGDFQSEQAWHRLLHALAQCRMDGDINTWKCRSSTCATARHATNISRLHVHEHLLFRAPDARHGIALCICLALVMCRFWRLECHCVIASVA